MKSPDGIVTVINGWFVSMVLVDITIDMSMIDVYR